MVQHKQFSPQQFGWVCAFVAASTPLTTSFSVLAQAPSYETFAKNAKVRIHSSNSMMAMNNALKQKFEGKFSSATVNINTMSAKRAIEDVINDKAEVAAIGRPLTDEEKAKGLSEVMVGRDKIAIVVSPNSPFTKDLTIPKFAKMFRGEISNWSDIGGPKEAISFVDRVNSDTRTALATYPQFQGAPFESGKNAVKLEDTSMKALIATLKSSGVSFVPANQAKVQSGLRTLTMHGVLPTDARYPFSQPLYYVYKGNGGAMRDEVKAIVGFLGTTAGQETVKKAGITPAPKAELLAASGTSTPEKPGDKPAGKAAEEKVPGTGTAPLRANGSPSGLEEKGSEKGNDKVAVSNNAISPEQDGNLFGLAFPSWLRWLLPLGLLGMGLLLLLMPRKNDRGDLRFDDSSNSGPGFGNPLSGAGNAIGDAARNTTEIVGNTASSVANAGGTALAGGAAAIGGLAAGEAGALRGEGDRDVWNDTDGAPYIKDDTDLNRFDAAKTVVGDAASATTQTLGDLAGAGGAAGAGVAAAAAGAGAAAWGFLKGDQGVESQDPLPNLDATSLNVPSEITSEFSAVGQEWEFGESAPAESLTSNLTSNLTNTVESIGDGLGNAAGNVSDRIAGTASGLGTAASGFFDRLKGGAANLADGVTQAGTTAGAAAAGAAAAGAAAIGGTAAAARTRLVGDRAGIVIVPQTAREAVVRWQLTESQKMDARTQGGIDHALRLYDVTGINPDRDVLENFYQYDCSELTQELRIEVPVPARDYVVEVGYLDRTGEWIGIARSLPIHIPSA